MFPNFIFQSNTKMKSDFIFFLFKEDLFKEYEDFHRQAIECRYQYQQIFFMDHLFSLLLIFNLYFDKIIPS